MKKRTRSILDELRNIGRIKDTEAFIETTGSNICLLYTSDAADE